MLPIIFKLDLFRTLSLSPNGIAHLLLKGSAVTGRLLVGVLRWDRRHRWQISTHFSFAPSTGFWFLVHAGRMGNGIEGLKWDSFHSQNGTVRLTRCSIAGNATWDCGGNEFSSETRWLTQTQTGGKKGAEQQIKCDPAPTSATRSTALCGSVKRFVLEISSTSSIWFRQSNPCRCVETDRCVFVTEEKVKGEGDGERRVLKPYTCAGCQCCVPKRKCLVA